MSPASASGSPLSRLGRLHAIYLASAIVNRPPLMPPWSAYFVPVFPYGVVLFLVVVLLINPIFLGTDSMQHYSHVWYLAESLFNEGRFPLHIHLLDSGRAVSLPYAVVPYLLGAVIFPLAREWGVNLLMAVAVVGNVAAAALVRPVMRDPWLMLLFLINPLFIDAVFAFQFAALWHSLFFFLFVWSFERRRYPLAILLLWLSLSTHPVVGGLILAGYGICLLTFDRQKVVPLALVSAPAAIVLLPQVWLGLQVPSARDAPPETIAGAVASATARRSSWIIYPLALTVLAPLVRRHYPAFLGALTAGLALGVVMLSGLVSYPNSPSGYVGIYHQPTYLYEEFFRSPAFQPGAVYRVLEPGEREHGMYRFIQNGAVLANEFFNETLFHRRWTGEEYGCYGAYKGLDFVVVERAYVPQKDRGEEALLKSLESEGHATVVYRDPAGEFAVYDVKGFVAGFERPGSLRECGIG